MSTIYLIRHGRTPANEQHLYCGSTDLELTEQGIGALKELYYDIRPQRIVTSGMIRTEQTLRVQFGSVEHEVDPRFREVDFGEFEMKSYEQLKDEPDYQRWITGGNMKNVPPGGESGQEMTRRVLEAYREVERSGLDTLIVTHGGVIAAILDELFPNEEKNRYQWQPKPGHGYAVFDGKYREIP